MVVKVTPLSSLRLCPALRLRSSCSGEQMGYLALRGLTAPPPQAVSRVPVTLSEDLPGSFRLPEEMLWPRLAFSRCFS